MQNHLEFKLIQNFKCKRCGCTHYDKLMYTGMKTLDESNSIIEEKYVCRNCDFPFDITDYIQNDNLQITSNELLDTSIFVDEGTEIQLNGESIKKENINE